VRGGGGGVCRRRKTGPIPKKAMLSRAWLVLAVKKGRFEETLSSNWSYKKGDALAATLRKKKRRRLSGKVTREKAADLMNKAHLEREGGRRRTR